MTAACAVRHEIVNGFLFRRPFSFYKNELRYLNKIYVKITKIRQISCKICQFPTKACIDIGGDIVYNCKVSKRCVLGCKYCW